MGLDVYLNRCEDRTAAKAAEEKVEAYGTKLWKEIFGDDEAYKVLSDNQQQAMWEKYNEEKKAFAATIGCTREYEQHASVTKIEQDSVFYPQHYFKVGYFRSSYNEGGINSVLRKLGIPDLYYIFDAGDSYEFTPDWEQARTRVNEVIDAYEQYLKSPVGNISISVVEDNMFGNAEDEPKSEAEALVMVRKEIESYQQAGKSPFSSGYSNRYGDFFMEGATIVGLIRGKSNKFGANERRCTYVAFKNEPEEKYGNDDFYLAALKIVRETIEYVLAQKDPNAYYLSWSS